MLRGALVPLCWVSSFWASKELSGFPPHLYLAGVYLVDDVMAPMVWEAVALQLFVIWSVSRFPLPGPGLLFRRWFRGKCQAAFEICFDSNDFHGQVASFGFDLDGGARSLVRFTSFQMNDYYSTLMSKVWYLNFVIESAPELFSQLIGLFANYMMVRSTIWTSSSFSKEVPLFLLHHEQILQDV